MNSKQYDALMDYRQKATNASNAAITAINRGGSPIEVIATLKQKCLDSYQEYCRKAGVAK